MTVYLLHLDTPIAHASHYMGWAENLGRRILEHQNTMWEPPDEAGKPGTTYGRGATFIGVANSRGIRWRLVRTWAGADRSFERRLKNSKIGPRLCPACSGKTAFERMKGNHMECQHTSRVGDNYGESCADCGEQLSGFGYGGWFGNHLTGQEICIHLWSPIGDAMVCVYCEQWKPAEETAQ